MEIRLAEMIDKRKIMKYDRHVHHLKINECIRNRLIYVLCDGGDILGVLRFNWFWQTVPFVDLLYIDEGIRGQGWGSKMMAFWESEMKIMADYVMLSTQEDETAKFFYEKIGYRAVGAFLPPEQDAKEIMYVKEFSK